MSQTRDSLTERNVFELQAPDRRAQRYPQKGILERAGHLTRARILPSLSSASVSATRTVSTVTNLKDLPQMFGTSFSTCAGYICDTGLQIGLVGTATRRRPKYRLNVLSAENECPKSKN